VAINLLILFADLVRDTSYRSSSKRNLRKRAAAGLDLPDRRSNGYSSRGDTPRRRAAADRSGTPLRLEAPVSNKEEDELESEYMQLKVTHVFMLYIGQCNMR
jgi:hypothetical protein